MRPSCWEVSPPPRRCEHGCHLGVILGPPRPSALFICLGFPRVPGQLVFGLTVSFFRGRRRFWVACGERPPPLVSVVSFVLASRLARRSSCTVMRASCRQDLHGMAYSLLVLHSVPYLAQAWTLYPLRLWCDERGKKKQPCGAVGHSALKT